MNHDPKLSPRLRIWLVQIGEELPFDPGPPRLLRTGLLANELVRRGHDVTFWNASFNHQQKLQRAEHTTYRSTEYGYRVVLMAGRPYTRNISLGRILSHRENAAAFLDAAKGEQPPDVMICGLPSLEIADAAAAYAAANRVPIAIDCRDLWPDIIEDYLPVPLRMAAFPILAYWRRMRHRALSRATAITGVSEGFMSWGLKAAGRSRTPLDRVFHLTPPAERPSDADLASARDYWDGLIGPPEAGVTVGVYAGSLSRRFDLISVAAAYKGLTAGQKAKLKLVICGKGDVEGELVAAASGEPSLVVPGWRSAAQLHALMERADFGILPYPSSNDFLVTFPNKVGEYLSFGLPIMTGLGGVIGATLVERGIALTYRTGDGDSARQLLSRIAEGAIDLPAMRAPASGAFDDFFNPDKILPAFADFLEELSGSPVRAR